MKFVSNYTQKEVLVHVYYHNMVQNVKILFVNGARLV